MRLLTPSPLSQVAKEFGKKFATGSSVTKTPAGGEEIVVQGDVSPDIEELILEKYREVPEDNIELVEDKKKGKDSKAVVAQPAKEVNPSVKLGGYLNLMYVTTSARRSTCEHTRTNLCLQCRFYTQHHRWSRHVRQLLRLTHHRRHHHRCCFLP